MSRRAVTLNSRLNFNDATYTTCFLAGEEGTALLYNLSPNESFAPTNLAATKAGVALLAHLDALQSAEDAFENVLAQSLYMPVCAGSRFILQLQRCIAHCQNDIYFQRASSFRASIDTGYASVGDYVKGVAQQLGRYAYAACVGPCVCAKCRATRTYSYNWPGPFRLPTPQVRRPASPASPNFGTPSPGRAPTSRDLRGSRRADRIAARDALNAPPSPVYSPSSPVYPPSSPWEEYEADEAKEDNREDMHQRDAAGIDLNIADGAVARLTWSLFVAGRDLGVAERAVAERTAARLHALSSPSYSPTSPAYSPLQSAGGNAN